MKAAQTSSRNVTHISVSKQSQLVKWNGYQLQDGVKSLHVKTIPGTIQPSVKLVLEQLQPG
jgi:hypothetical protein